MCHSVTTEHFLQKPTETLEDVIAGRKWAGEPVTMSSLTQVKPLTHSPMFRKYNPLMYNDLNAMDEHCKRKCRPLRRKVEFVFKHNSGVSAC